MSWESELRKRDFLNTPLVKKMNDVLEEIKRKINSLDRSKYDASKDFVEEYRNALDDAQDLLAVLENLEKEYSEYYKGGGLRQNPAYAGKDNYDNYAELARKVGFWTHDSEGNRIQR